MAKKIYTILSLKDEFSKKMQVAAKNTKEFKQQSKMANNIVKSFATSANSKFKSIAKNSLKLTAGLTAIGGALSIAGIKAYASESTAAAKAQIEAETKLGAVLQNVKSIQEKGPGYYKQAKKELMGVASNLQKVGVIGDEVSLAGMQQLATFQLSEKEIGTLSKGMTDLLAQQKGLNATQQDAVGIGNMIGKVMQGQTGALSRVGITFDKAQEKALKLGTAEQRAAVLAEILEQNVGGVNSALAKTDQGQIQQTANAYGDMKEEIGKKLLPIQAKFAAWFATKIPGIQSKILGLLDKASGKIDWFLQVIDSAKPHLMLVGSVVKTIAKTAFKVLGKTIGFVKDNMNWLLPVAAGLVGGIIAFNVVNTAIKAFKAFRTALFVCKIMMAAFNLTMLANPLFWIPAVIALAIAAGIALWKNWDKIKKKAEKLFKPIKKIVDKIKEFFNFGKKKKVELEVETTETKKTKEKGGKKGGGNKTHKRNALGTSFFSGGFTAINERGRQESAILPSGTQIIPAGKTKEMQSKRNFIINLYLTIQGNVIGDKRFANMISDEVCRKILVAMDNM